MAAHAAGGAALGGVIGVRRDLNAGRHRAWQRRGAGSHGHHDRRVAEGRGRVDRAEPDHPGASSHPDAGHAGSGPALRPHGSGTEPQQLGVAGDEYQVGLLMLQLHGPDHVIALPQRDRVELGEVLRVVRCQPFDRALCRPYGQARSGRLARHQGDDRLSALGRNELADRSAAGEPGSMSCRRQSGNFHHAQPDEPAAGGEHAHGPPVGGVHRRDDDVVRCSRAGDRGLLRLCHARPRDKPGGRQEHNARVVGDL